MEQEGQQLAKASFGPTILLSIGKAYERQAAIHLGGFFQGSLVSLKQEGHSIKSKVLFASHLCTPTVPQLVLNLAQFAPTWYGGCCRALSVLRCGCFTQQMCSCMHLMVIAEFASTAGAECRVHLLLI